MSHCNTDNFNYFLICEPLARCAKRGSSLPLGTTMEIDFTSAYLHYPFPQCSKIVTSIIFSISYELFRLPSAKVPQDYHLLRTFVWCLVEKLTRNNGLFLNTYSIILELTIFLVVFESPKLYHNPVSGQPVIRLRLTDLTLLIFNPLTPKSNL